jgi:XTP/dITP diphosphohydrolase
MSKMSEIRFVSRNKYKLEEFEQLMAARGYSITVVKEAIDELQTEDMDKLIRDKTIKAFKLIGRPLVVEHTGLFLEKLNGLPGGLTQMFWDKLEDDRFAQLFGTPPHNRAIATTVLAYCDGRRIRTFDGSTNGTIAERQRGDRHFQWDTLFVPEGHAETFAQMGLRKNEISMRHEAINKFVSWFENDRT